MAKNFSSMILLLLVCYLIACDADAVCDNNINGIVTSCRSAASPSATCCKFFRQTKLSCACPRITSDVTKYYSLTTILRLAKACKRTLPHNYQCGSYHFP